MLTIFQSLEIQTPRPCRGGAVWYSQQRVAHGGPVPGTLTTNLNHPQPFELSPGWGGNAARCGIIPRVLHPIRGETVPVGGVEPSSYPLPAGAIDRTRTCYLCFTKAAHCLLCFDGW